MQGVTVIVLLTSSVAQAETAHLNENTPLTAARAAAGWVVFVGVVVLTYEIAFIACRFLNFAFMTKYRLICLIIVCWCCFFKYHCFSSLGHNF